MLSDPALISNVLGIQSTLIIFSGRKKEARKEGKEGGREEVYNSIFVAFDSGRIMHI